MESQLRAGQPDVEGLCLALLDWSAELRLLRESHGLPLLRQVWLMAKHQSGKAGDTGVCMRVAENPGFGDCDVF